MVAAMALLAGWLLLYVPSFIDLADGLWATDANGHGPIVLVMGLWFLWFRYKSLSPDDIRPSRNASIAGWISFGFGVLLYAVGRSQDFAIFEVGSMIPLLLGLCLIVLGATAAKKLWFGFVFLMFMVPLPGALVDTVTQPMKVGVSWGSEHLLRALDYPVARNGVILYVGQYQLLVADACAGLHSLFTLEALGLLYMNVTRHESAFRNAVLALLIVPISFTANIVRVVTLALITYYLGDSAGQGFLHGFSGMVLFISALLLIIGVDSLLRYMVYQKRTRHGS